jgi:hypothetical protein
MKECEVEIMSEDYATLQSKLSGTVVMDVHAVDPVLVADESRERKNCTRICN